MMHTYSKDLAKLHGVDVAAEQLCLALVRVVHCCAHLHAVQPEKNAVRRFDERRVSQPCTPHSHCKDCHSEPMTVTESHDHVIAEGVHVHDKAQRRGCHDIAMLINRARAHPQQCMAACVDKCASCAQTLTVDVV